MGYRINRSEREQQLLNMLFSYLGEHYDSSELYEILHHDLGMTHSDIELLGFDLKDCYCMESNEINMGRLNLNAETDLSRLMERPMLLSTVHLSLIDRDFGGGGRSSLRQRRKICRGSSEYDGTLFY